MILHLDASALVKRYVAEAGTAEVFAVLGQADTIGTGLICRAEVAEALAKAVRTRALTCAEGSESLRSFRQDWPASFNFN
jgi:predicted nucleic acid-binding protein